MLILFLILAAAVCYVALKGRKQAVVLTANLANLSERDRSKAKFHVERFQRALEQCVNPAKKPELERNLEYWRVIAAAEEARNN